VKRFIAGATCPSCGALDKIYVMILEDIKWQRCAACHYQVGASDKTKSTPEDGVQTVLIIDSEGHRS